MFCDEPVILGCQSVSVGDELSVDGCLPLLWLYFCGFYSCSFCVLSNVKNTYRNLCKTFPHINMFLTQHTFPSYSWSLQNAFCNKYYCYIINPNSFLQWISLGVQNWVISASITEKKIVHWKELYCNNSCAIYHLLHK